jgi:hypothetical protein
MERESWKRALIERKPVGGDYDAMKRCRLIPSFLILHSSVCLGMPSFAAAPVGPEIRPSAWRNAFSMIAFSRSARSATKGIVGVVGLGEVGLEDVGASQLGSTQKFSPSQTTMGAFDDVLQFPNVTGPGIALEQIHRALTHTSNSLAGLLGVAVHQVFH